MTTKLLSKAKMFDGTIEYHSHQSTTCQSEMRFSIYLPPAAEKRPVPVLYWLSGLTCTEENFMVKSGAQQHAARNGIAIVCPDTSPRNTGIEGEAASWDFGAGAGFYVNATRAPWSKHFNMYDYVNTELPALLHARFPLRQGRESISGHSMGGHGALVLALRNPLRFQSVSAFSPIVAPSQCPWGEKAFTKYLGDDRNSWLQYDAVHLLSQASHAQPLLIDQGLDDKFLTEQLKPELLQAVASKRDYPLTLRMQPGYDHSYYFIASFIKDHIDYHAQQLNKG